MKRKTHNIRRRLTATAAALAIALGGIGIGALPIREIQAEETTENTDGDWEYRILEDGTAEIVRYIGSETNLEIPRTFNGSKVTKIGEGAFLECSSLESVNIPESVTEIGVAAFNGCELLSKVNIPKGITRINMSVFDGCKSLKNITIPNGVTYIGNAAFAHCAVKNLTIPSSIEEINVAAFMNCKELESVTILGENLKNLGWQAFVGCESLKYIVLPRTFTFIPSECFYGCMSLESVDISSSVTHIYSYAFTNCDSLKSVKIPNTVTDIQSYAFGYHAEFVENEGWVNTKIPDFTIYGYAGSAAETYAKENHFIFIEITEESEEEPTEAPTEKPAEPNVESASNAAITVEATGEFTPKLEMTDDEILSAIAKLFTEEQLAAITAGEAELDVKLAVTNIDGSVSDEDRELIEKAVESIPENEKFNFKVMNYLDIKLEALIDGKGISVTETDGMITVSVELENPANGTYKVVRIHDSKTDVIDSQLSKDGKRLTFKTDKFSTYAIVYSDVATGDRANAALAVVLCFVGLAGFTAALNTVKRRKAAKTGVLG
ncbi:MAG: leucine-rich repeat domain-containing protein [Butyrivibrio sp.]|nr:leucine-rich repeat domain-containing protein [Butyrivibrio sp.]